MKHYILYGHGGSGNHGCEALARTTTQILDNKSNRITLVSDREEEDRYYHLDEICEVIPHYSRVNKIHKSVSFWRAYYDLKVKHNYVEMDNVSELQALGARRGDIALSIGGDSYCYGDSLKKELMRQHQLFSSHGIKTVFWGCSIEPWLLDDEAFISDIESFDLITARESISYDLLKSINPRTILVSDPAFTLSYSNAPLPYEIIKNGAVGINASPLLEEYNSEKSIIRENYQQLIESILCNTKFSILLVPHVVWKINDDGKVLLELYNQYKESGRVYICQDQNCCELKRYISQCRFFIAARTHASIAAYSTEVPTLVLGYSTKSKGIATDLFGSFENFVIPVQDLTSAGELTDRWNWLQKNEEVIRKQLKDKLPRIIGKVYDGQDAINRI